MKKRSEPLQNGTFHMPNQSKIQVENAGAAMKMILTLMLAILCGALSGCHSVASERAANHAPLDSSKQVTPGLAPSQSSSTTNQERPNMTEAIIDETKMVSDMMYKLRRFLTEKPLTAEEIMALFELKRVRKTSFPTGESLIQTYGEFPLTQSKVDPFNLDRRTNGGISLKKNHLMYSFSLNFYDLRTRFVGKKDVQPKGAPGCFPNKDLLALLKDLNYVPKRWDDGTTTRIEYLKQTDTDGSYEGVSITDTGDQGSCLRLFTYSSNASLYRIKM